MAERKRVHAKPPKQIKRTKKKPLLTIKQRLRIIAIVLVLTAAGVMCLLHFTGIFTFNDLLYELDIKDRPATRADLEVHFVDVGQGDCILIKSKGEVMLIDAGDREHSHKTVSYLKKNGIRKIKYLVATHPHADHIGAMSDIIWTFRVEKIIAPKISDDIMPTTLAYERMLAAVQGTGARMTPAKDQTLKVGDCEVQVMTSHLYDDEDLNNHSVVLKLTHGENTFLFTADAEKEEEADLLAREMDVKAKVLKVGHHGSYTSSSAEFLDAVEPEYAVISSGYMNDYGHPHESTMRRLEKYADKIYNTAYMGNVVFISDGEGLTVYYTEDRT